MTRDEEKGESPLEKAAIRYAEAASEVRRLTRKLGEFDEDGPALSCSKPLVDATSQTSRACRKWTYERSDYSEGGTGDGYWESAREREEWCSACVAVQEIVDQRRAAKKKRAAALAAIGNIARGMIRRLALNGVQPVSAPVGAEAGGVTLEFLLRVFRLGGFDDHPEFWWRTDGKYAPVTLFINCNDLFYWACADAEELTPANIEVYEKAYADLDAILPREKRTDENQKEGPVRDAWLARGSRRIHIMSHVDSLFCARVRGMRPQRPCYPRGMRREGDKRIYRAEYDLPEVCALYDACGPERDRKEEG